MSGSDSSIPASASAEPLALTIHSLPQPSLALDRRTRSGRLKMLVLLAVCAAPVLASYFTYFVIRPETRTNYAELVLPPRDLPASLKLTDLDGRSVAGAALKGQWILAVAGSGACGASCDRILFLQRQLREMMGRDRDRVDKVWFVTDDVALRPELRAAVGRAPAVTVLRVQRDELERWLEPASGAALEQHLYIVDPVGQWMMRAPVDPDPAKLKRDLERLLRASSSWDRAGRL